MPHVPSGSAQAMTHRHKTRTDDEGIMLFLCGDVMTGRGIDQVLPFPAPPNIYEPFASSARDYVELAQRANGPIRAPVPFDYIWGVALDELERGAPDLRLINLETAVTRSEHKWPYKGIHYRMSPENVPCLQAARIDGCILANNHVLDWGYEGLEETLATLQLAGIRTIGAGRSEEEAATPVVFDLASRHRVLVLALAHTSSGVPATWRAGVKRPGVALIDTLSAAAVERAATCIAAVKEPGDLVVASIHWGGNWGYQVPGDQQRFARALVDHAGVDLVHGHSSHHPKAIEVYRGHPILYGCGDFINDYEGISGHQAYRPDLSLMYFAHLDAGSGQLLGLTMTPLQMRRFRLQRPPASDRHWLAQTMDRECSRFGSRVSESPEGRLELAWGSMGQRG